MTVSLQAIALAGILSGWVMGMSAAAWGALSVPLLILIGVEPLAAINSSLAASIVLSLFGGLTHWRYDRSRMVALIPLLLGGAAGGVLGGFLSPTLPPSILQVLIGVTTLCMGLLTLVQHQRVVSSTARERDTLRSSGRRATVVGIGAVAGLFTGAFGAGWGTIGIALLVWAGIPPHSVVGSSLLARSVVALAAMGSYALQWRVPPVGIFVPLLVAGGAGVYFGVAIADGFSAHRLRTFLGAVVCLVGILTMGNSLW